MHGGPEIYTDLISLNWTFLFVMVTFLVFVFLMKKIFFDKVSNFMDKRKNEIADSYDVAAQKIQEAEDMRLDYERRMKMIKDQGLAIVKESKAKAEVKAQRIVQDAEKKAYNIIWQAEEQIKHDREAAVQDMQQYIAELAVLVAGKVIEENLNAQEQQAIVGKVIEEVGNGKWQN